MSLAEFLQYTQWLFIIYFLGLQSGYILLSLLALTNIWGYMQAHSHTGVPRLQSGLELPVSLLVPAYNEEGGITDSVLALLQLNYPAFEVIVINDGSTDGTMQELINSFDLQPFPEAYRVRIKTKNIRNIYVSKKFKNIRVIDKDNGGKADSLNAGINLSRYPLFCAVDADSILQPSSLEKVVAPFMEEENVVATGGTIRILNGCEVENGFVNKVQLPRHPMALLQVAEYLRAFLFGRLGWTSINGLLIISGAFGVFHKETVVSVGGYLTNTIGEDMELVVRMHRILRERKRPYKIVFVPDPICWSEAPQDLKTLRSQRIRWQRGLCESLTKNMGLLKQGGIVGWVAFPFMFIFEFLGPVIEIIGAIVMITSFATGYASIETTILFLTVAIGFGMMLSITAILLEEMSFHVYKSPIYALILAFVALVENLGYRQLNSYWRMIAMVQWMRGTKSSWGKMQRNSSWKKDDKPTN